MKIDILYLACGRPEFTQASLSSLLLHTNPALVDRLLICLDGGADIRLSAIAGLTANMMFDHFVNRERHGGPVAIMNKFLDQPGAPIFAKIDNDVILPPGWLDAAAAVMQENPTLDFLGIEPPASRTRNPSRIVHMAGPPAVPEDRTCQGGYASTYCVGGVGLFRRSVFEGRPRMAPHHSGRGGFGEWQLLHHEVTKGWIVPPLKLFLLDRLPFEPWLSLSKKYNAEGIQRPWTNYEDTPANAAELWAWWKP